MKRLLVVACLLASLGEAHADRKKALMYFRAGEKAYQAQNFEAAAQNFDEAFKALPLPEIAFSAAQAYRRQYRVRPEPAHVERAIELYRFYLDKVKTGGRVGDAADSLGEMERERDRLGAAARPPVAAPVVERTRLGVTVRVAGERTDDTMYEVADTVPVGADVKVVTTIDGKPVEPDMWHDVAPGDRVIRAEAAGFAPVERTLRAIAGSSDMVEIELKPLPARVTIATEPGARITVDGKGMGLARTLELAAGRHVLAIVRRGRQPVARELVVTRGEAVSVAQPLAPTWQRRLVPWTIGAAGVLAASAAATGVVALRADGKASDALDALRAGDQAAELLGEYEAARDRRDAFVDATWALGGAALGVGLLAGALYYFDTPSAEGLQVVPSVSAGLGGAVVTGQF